MVAQEKRPIAKRKTKKKVLLRAGANGAVGRLRKVLSKQTKDLLIEFVVKLAKNDNILMRELEAKCRHLRQKCILRLWKQFGLQQSLMTDT